MSDAYGRLRAADHQLVTELREHLESVRYALDCVCRRTDVPTVESVRTAVEAGRERVEEALRTVPAPKIPRRQLTVGEFEPVQHLRETLDRADDALAVACRLAEECEHRGVLDVLDEVGEATSMVRRARRALLDAR